MDINRTPPAVNGGGADAFLARWIARSAFITAATHGTIDVVIEPDPERDAPALRVALRDHSIGHHYAVMPLKAANAQAAAHAVVAVFSLAIEAREGIGMIPEVGFIRAIVMQDERVWRFDPLVSAFLEHYGRAADEYLERIEREGGAS